MIYLEDIIHHDPSERVQTRAKSSWVTKVAIGHYRIVPTGEYRNRVKRRVQFGFQGRDRIFAICSDWNTDETCKANSCGQLCGHVYAAYKQLLKTAEKFL